jgi:hypothetical protein
MASVPELDQLWLSAAFQRAVRELLLVPPETLASLHDSDTRSEEPPGNLTRNVGAGATAAHQTLYTLARDHTARDVVDRLVELAPDLGLTENKDLRVALLDALQFDPEKERRVAFEDAEQEFMPMLTRVQSYLDLRAVSPPSEHDEQDLGERVELLPVLIARLTFDEPIGGSESITIQVPWRHIAALLEQIPALRAQRAALRNVLPHRLTRAAAWRDEDEL